MFFPSLLFTHEFQFCLENPAGNLISLKPSLNLPLPDRANYSLPFSAVVSGLGFHYYSS